MTAASHSSRDHTTPSGMPRHMQLPRGNPTSVPRANHHSYQYSPHLHPTFCSLLQYRLPFCSPWIAGRPGCKVRSRSWSSLPPVLKIYHPLSLSSPNTNTTDFFYHDNCTDSRSSSSRVMHMHNKVIIHLKIQAQL